MSQEIHFGRPILDDAERKAVADVLDGPILVHGPHAVAFEDAFAAFVGGTHAVSVSSCTAGMHLVWFALGIGPGDEVIVPAMTHVATAHAVALMGAKPVFVDAVADTGNIDIDKIEAAINANTKAIAVVHYLGVPVDMAKVSDIAKRHGLFVLEDCALSHGGRVDGIHTGLLSDVGVFSFYPVKHMTTAEGGMVITKNQELADKLRLLRAFGVDRTHGERAIPGVYDTVALGFNYRMSEIHAAIGIEQVKKLPSFLETRHRNDAALRKAIRENCDLVPLSSPTGRFDCAHYCISVMLPDGSEGKRPEIIQGLKSLGVGSSVYYPHPVPRMTYYQSKYGYDPLQWPVAARIADGSIALPVGPHLDEDDMKRIATALKETLQSVFN